jgi:peroxiredoxin
MLSIGDRAPFNSLQTVDGEQVPLVNGSGLVHLQLRRFSGCPLCHIHLRNYAREMDVVLEHGVTPVVVFHSSPDVIVENTRHVDWAAQFKFVADPDRELYKKAGAELSGWRYLFRMRIKTFALALSGMPGLMKRKRWGAEAGLTQRPMDILIDSKDGRILDLKYGIDSNDQWPVSDVVAGALRHSNPAP